MSIYLKNVTIAPGLPYCWKNVQYITTLKFIFDVLSINHIIPTVSSIPHLLYCLHVNYHKYFDNSNADANRIVLCNFHLANQGPRL